MRTAQVLCVCCFIAAAASECGGDPSCVAEKDAAALLQSAVQIHGTGKAQGQGSEEEAAGEQAGENQEEQKEQGDCSRMGSKEACKGASKCSWTGSKCAVGCKTFNGNKRGCNDAAYCFWYYQGDYCKDTLPEMYVGGDPNDWGWQAKKNGGYGTSGRTKMAYRPEYKTTKRYNEATSPAQWEPCGDDKNCWYGTGSRDLKFKLSSDSYSKVAVEVNINCADEEKIEVAYKVYQQTRNNWLQNAELKVNYNLEPLASSDADWAKTPMTRRRKESTWSLRVPITKDDDTPILIVEASRGQDKTGTASGKAEIRIMNSKASFDKCMVKKETHAQCLTSFASASSDLRSSHKKQKLCVDGRGASIPGCKDWLKCLDDDTKKLISRVAGAFGEPQQLLLGQGLTNVWQNKSRPRFCVNPTTVDIEAFDCNCFDWLKGKNQVEINARACDDKRICCEWKKLYCSNGASLLCEPVLTESTLTSAEEGGEEGLPDLELRQQKDSQDEASLSLDESLSGKRC